MNELNYASFEASKRLVEAGIILEAEYCWYITGKMPKPSMAEVWRELPDGICIEKHIAFTQANYPTGELYTNKIFCNTNPTDALIDLLIWVRKEKP